MQCANIRKYIVNIRKIVHNSSFWDFNQISTNQFKNVQKTLLQVKQKYLIVLKKSDYLQDGDFLMIKVSVCKHFISKVFAE